MKLFQRECTVIEDVHPCRIILENDKHELRSSLEELQSTWWKILIKVLLNGFSSELITDVVENSYRIFSIEDILTYDFS